MKENYKAWDIRIGDFFKQQTEYNQLKFLIGFAILAPSSHNSQPWSFSIKGNTISVFADPRRQLKESDPNNRQLYISLGCAIENLVVAADYYSFSPTINYFPDSADQTFVAAIVFNKGVTKGQDNHLIFEIPKRTSNRNKYENRIPGEEFLKKIKALEISGLRIDIVSDKERKDAVANIALVAMQKAMNDKHFRNELSSYVKSNITESKIGMPGFGLGFPLPISLVAPTMLRRFDMSKLTRKQDEVLLKKFTPAFVILSTRQDDNKNWTKAGQVFEHIALLAEQSNIKTAVWAAPIQIGDYYRALQDVLKTDFRPQIFFRIGHTDKVTRHSPRLPAQEVLLVKK